MTDAARQPASTIPPERRIDATAVLMGVAFATIWSSAFSSAKIALVDAPPFLMLGFRFLLSGLAAVALAAALGQRLPRDRRVWTLIAVFGFCQNTLYLGLNFLAMTTVPAGLAAIIASALPLIVAAIGWAQGERLPLLGLLGLAVGFAGVVLIMWGRIEGGVDPVGVALCVAGLLALAVATRVVAGATAGGDLLMIVGLQMLVGSATLFPVGFAFESVHDVNPTLSLGLAFAYTTIMPGLVATLIWFALVNRIGATAASAFHFLNPGLGVGVAAIVVGETLSWIDAAGVAIVTMGIAAVQLAKRRMAAR
jgi:drug/metabolite transporter (DMT)-like permease